VPADYDGDGRIDIAAYLPWSRVFWVIRSTTGTLVTLDLSGSTPAGAIPVLRKPQ
jgi:hypothetical protein